MPAAQAVHGAFSSIARRYCVVNHVLSLGIDVLWRARAVERVAEWTPSSVLDVATGTGDLALDIMRELPETEVLGVDFCEPMLDIARRRGLRHSLCADALHLPLDTASFDVVTTAFGLRNMADYSAAVREFHRVLRPGGHLLILDFAMPEGLFSFPYRFYLHRILPPLAGLLTGASGAYTYLGESIEQFPRGDALCRILLDQAFTDALFLPLLGGIAAIYTAQKTPQALLS